MLDHIVLSVHDLARSIAFYETALGPLGIRHAVDYAGRDGHADLHGFGRDGRMFFWLRQGRPCPEAIHFGFDAEARAVVDAFHAAALEAGGRDNGKPGPRLRYDPDYYAAYVLDPDGYNVEAVHKPWQHGVAIS